MQRFLPEQKQQAVVYSRERRKKKNVDLTNWNTLRARRRLDSILGAQVRECKCM